MNEYSTTVKLLPVCNCGYVFRNGITIRRDIRPLERTGLVHEKEYIEPALCPSCQRLIEYIEYDVNVIKYKDGL